MEEKNAKRLAVFLPGIGYTADKPLMYYSRKLAAAHGYETLCVSYHDLPAKTRGDRSKLMLAADMAYAQAKEALQGTDLSGNVTFIGKSIGTIAAARLAETSAPKARLILYTPLEETFARPLPESIAFLGTADPWSELRDVRRLAAERNVPLHLYLNANHSLETGDALYDIGVLREVCVLTDEFLRTGEED